MADHLAQQTNAQQTETALVNLYCAAFGGQNGQCLEALFIFSSALSSSQE